MPWAFALFRANAAAHVRIKLDPDNASAHVAQLTDGSLVVRTDVPFAELGEKLHVARGWLETLGPTLSALHDDSRGVLLFRLPEAAGGMTGYDAVVDHAGSDAVWLDASTADADLASVDVGRARASEILNRAIDNVMRDMLSRETRPLHDEDLVIIVKRKTPLRLSLIAEDPNSSAHDAFLLADGAIVIRTTLSRAASDELSLLLAEWHTEWVAEHDDPRGVPAFTAMHLERVREAGSYERALEGLGAALEFLVPRSLMEIGVTLPLARHILGR